MKAIVSEVKRAAPAIPRHESQYTDLRQLILSISESQAQTAINTQLQNAHVNLQRQMMMQAIDSSGRTLASWEWCR